jgi:hypothetical protein
MSIRMLAVELYRVKKEVEELEKKIENLSTDSPEKESLKWRLREGKAEHDRLKALMEGAKES